MYAELMQKTCTKCTLLQPIVEFYKNSRYADGYVSWCRSCKKTHARRNPQIYSRWVKNNKITSDAIKKRYADRNQAKVRQSKAKWSKANNKKVLAKTRRYQAAKLRRTPKWLTETQLKEMEAFYINCPKDFHVDHIIPLQGKNISGLHVPWNLQYLSADQNRKKSNKY